MNLKYKMNRKLYNSILDSRSGDERKMGTREFVMKYINDTFGLKGTVTAIIIED